MKVARLLSPEDPMGQGLKWVRKFHPELWQASQDDYA
jgi:hypothetical protein